MGTPVLGNARIRLKYRHGRIITFRGVRRISAHAPTHKTRLHQRYTHTYEITPWPSQTSGAVEGWIVVVVVVVTVVVTVTVTVTALLVEAEATVRRQCRPPRGTPR